jgi:endonuclease G, mitochondrial
MQGDNFAPAKMMSTRFTRLFTVSLLALLFCACSESPNKNKQANQLSPSLPKVAAMVVKQPIIEDFEGGDKKNYNAENVTLGSGNWTLDDALIGNTRAARTENCG